jgi:acyl-CoA reductase-like NAD-dependent aldehyde dehydrogenase
MKTYQVLIGGEWLNSNSDQWIDSIDPFSGEAWAQIPRCTPSDANKAVKAAKDAFRSSAWSNLSATARGQILYRFGDLVEQNVQVLAEAERRDNGKIREEVAGQARSAARWIRYYAGLADKLEGSVVPIDKSGVFAYTKLEPLGVIAAIVPWNSPLTLTTWKLAPALAAGNAIVIKPSEHASTSILEMARLAHEAGIPPGIINVITGYGNEVGDALIRHKDVSKIAFTGGEVGGQAVYRAAADDFKKVTLELGGKSPNIVFDDANVEEALKGAVAGVFGASGQSCLAGSRLLVQEGIHDRFVDRLVDVVAEAKIGDPSDPATQIGPISTRQQWEKILQMIELGRSEGATCRLGGHAVSGPGFGQGQFVAPTIFTGVRNDMRIAREEVFGPVLCVLKFKDEEEAIAIANDSDYGLASGVWTQNLKRAFLCADRLQAGTVWINNYRTTSFAMPFGGYKRSGIGREGGSDSIKEFVQVKSVWITMEPSRANPFTLG